MVMAPEVSFQRGLPRRSNHLCLNAGTWFKSRCRLSSTPFGSTTNRTPPRTSTSPSLELGVDACDARVKRFLTRLKTRVRTCCAVCVLMSMWVSNRSTPKEPIDGSLLVPPIGVPPPTDSRPLLRDRCTHWCKGVLRPSLLWIWWSLNCQAWPCPASTSPLAAMPSMVT